MSSSVSLCRASNFYPRPPRGGRRLISGMPYLPTPDFYPRPPRGGRLRAASTAVRASGFLSTPSARRATSPGPRWGLRGAISIHALREEGDDLPAPFSPLMVAFLSTPSARRATKRPPHSVADYGISIHALREEGDAATRKRPRTPAYFYPRPPRGGRLHTHVRSVVPRGFLSTPSARRATG